ncbi:MAG: hypothetical protein Q9M11_06910, partial [Mariprofundaceae bacterium]|nr:hypothetical protein [Mariprofundaceae bacterium]
MTNNVEEYRTISTEFPTLVYTDGKPVCTIEIDTGVLYQQQKYMNEGLDHLIQTIVATWGTNNAYDKCGTIWQWGSPSVNFGHSSYSMFYAILGMPKSFRDYLNQQL